PTRRSSDLGHDLMAAAITAEGLSKQYRIGQLQPAYGTLRDSIAHGVERLRSGHMHEPPETIWAIRDVSFEAEQGEVLGIIGPNGAGKSTLLKILTRITTPTKGRAEIRGRVGSLLEVGTGFHPELTGRENVFLNGSILGMTRREIARNFDAIVAFSEVEQFIDTPVKRYSSGMYIRLAFAVAAHLRPEILIVDEVLAVGDAAFQARCLMKMGEAAAQGQTVLFVSHNLHAISTLTRRSIQLAAGRLVADGPTPEVIQSYLQSGVSREATYVARSAAHGPRLTRVAVQTSSPRNIHVQGKPLEVLIEIATPVPLVSPCVSFQACDAMGQPI